MSREVIFTQPGQLAPALVERVRDYLDNRLRG